MDQGLARVGVGGGGGGGGGWGGGRGGGGGGGGGGVLEGETKAERGLKELEYPFKLSFLL